MDDAIGVLEADHEMLRVLFERFEMIRDDRSAAGKEMLVAEACRLLKRHMRVEENLFYPAVREALGDDGLVSGALAEHDGAKALIEDLEDMDAGSYLFNAAFRVLSEHFRRHVREEHEEMFPRLRDCAVDLEALGRKMAASMRDELKERRSRPRDSGSRSASGVAGD